MAKVAFVSFATGIYIEKQKKLVFSVRRFGYDIFTYTTFESIGSPTQQESPYEFKLHAIRDVYMKGYDIVIWCDSIIQLLRPITNWIPEIEKKGVYLQRDGHRLGTWANDRALEAFGVNRDDVMDLDTTIYACVMAFDFRHPITKKFFYRWKDCADKGLFKGRWTNHDQTESKDPRCKGHRHDQTCAELVALELKIEPGSRVMLIDSEATPQRYFTSRR
jgi:hypothetical protein